MNPKRSVIASMITVCVSLPAASTAGAVGAEPVSEGVTLSAEANAVSEGWDRFVAASAKSSDFRLRVIFSIDRVEDRGGINFPNETIPLESLVDQARGSTDPVVLSMLQNRCSNEPARCDALDFARRWTVAETQNQLAWTTLASVLHSKGDREGARATFQRAAQASMWHEHHADVARVIARSLPRTLSPHARMHGLTSALSTAAARTMPSYGYIRLQCKDVSMRDACFRILDTMFRDSDTLTSTSVSAHIAESAGGSEETVQIRKQRLNATFWALLQNPHLSELNDPTVMARAIQDVEQRIQLGEMAWARSILTSSGVSERDAAARLIQDHPNAQSQSRVPADPAATNQLWR